MRASSRRNAARAISLVGVAEARLVEAHARREPAEQLGVADSASPSGAIDGLFTCTYR